MFGFPKVEHKEFGKNFLKTVIFQLSYNKYELTQERFNEIEEIFKLDFPRFSTTKGQGFEISLEQNKTPSFQHVEKGHFLDMRSSDGQKILTINEEVLNLTITGKVYKSFDDISHHIDNIAKFFKLCNITKVSKVAVRKINIIEFKVIDDNPSNILDLLLNKDLIGNISFFPNQNNINQYLQSLNYNKEVNFLNIKYGLNLPRNQSEEKIGQVIIDIDLYKQEELEINKINSDSLKINSEIFNIFNWIISEKTLDILNG